MYGMSKNLQWAPSLIYGRVLLQEESQPNFYEDSPSYNGHNFQSGGQIREISIPLESLFRVDVRGAQDQENWS